MDSTDTCCTRDGDPWSAKQHHWKFEAKDHQLSSGGPSKFIVIEDFSTFIRKTTQAFMHGLVSCKNEKDQIKMKVLECSQHYTWIFQMLKGSLLCSQWSDLVEIPAQPSLYTCLNCPCFLQERRRSNQR